MVKWILTYCFILAFVFSFGQNELKNNNVSITTSGGVITLHNFELSNNGTIRDSFATWYISGNSNADESEIGGDSLTVLNNLTVNKSSGDRVVRLTGNFNVLGTINLDNGNIHLNQNNIYLVDEGRIFEENDTNRIFGVEGGIIYKDTVLNAPSALNPGNMGAEITTSSNLGQTRIIRGHNTQYNHDSSWQSINRWYDFEPTNNSGLSGSVRFHYLNPEINPHFHLDLEMWEDPSGIWTNLSVPYSNAHRDSANLWMLSTTRDSFIRLTLAPDTVPFLPSDLIEFGAKWISQPDVSEVYWTTAMELNVKEFIVLRSFDGQKFHSIDTVDATGNSNQIISYNSIDDNLNTSLFTDIVYYRLKQVDYDGQIQWSSIVPLVNSQESKLVIAAYPNPTSSIINLKFSDVRKDLIFEITNSIGKTINIFQSADLDELPIDFSSSESGIYFINVYDEFHRVKQVIKVIKY